MAGSPGRHEGRGAGPGARDSRDDLPAGDRRQDLGSVGVRRPDVRGQGQAGDAVDRHLQESFVGGGPDKLMATPIKIRIKKSLMFGK